MRLLEAVAATVIVAVALGGALFALSHFAKFTAQPAGPNRIAAADLAAATLRDAQDAWKYGSPGANPSGTASNVTSTLSYASAPASLTVGVRYIPDRAHNESGAVSLSGELMPKAPLPGSQVTRPGLIAQPSAAP